MLVDKLVIEKFEVVAKVQMPEGVRLIYDHIPLPFYDQEHFPFLISKGNTHNLFIVNTKDWTIQTLVKSE